MFGQLVTLLLPLSTRSSVVSSSLLLLLPLGPLHCSVGHHPRRHDRRGCGTVDGAVPDLAGQRAEGAEPFLDTGA